MSRSSARAGVRRRLGLTQTEAARRADVSLATWRRWEGGEKLRPLTATRCAQVLTQDRPASSLSDEDVDRIARRVVEMLGAKAMGS